MCPYSVVPPKAKPNLAYPAGGPTLAVSVKIDGLVKKRVGVSSTVALWTRQTLMECQQCGDCAHRNFRRDGPHSTRSGLTYFSIAVIKIEESCHSNPTKLGASLASEQMGLRSTT